MNPLIVKIESMTDASREIDAVITVAVNWRPDWCADSGGELWLDRTGSMEPDVRLNRIGKRSMGNPPIGKYPRFTASMDDARSIIPPDWRMQHLGEQETDLNIWECELHNRNENDCVQGDGITPALAICAAALKARERVTEAA